MIETLLGFIAGLIASGVMILASRKEKAKAEPIKADVKMKKTSAHNTYILDANLPVRVRYVLAHSGIQTVGDVIKYEKKDLLKFRNFGKVSLEQLEKFVEEQGVEWK